MTNEIFGIQIHFSFLTSLVSALVLFILAMINGLSLRSSLVISIMAIILMLAFPLIAVGLAVIIITVITMFQLVVSDARADESRRATYGHVNAPSAPLDESVRVRESDYQCRVEPEHGYDNRTEILNRVRKMFSGVNVYVEYNVIYNAHTLVYESKKWDRPVINHMITTGGEHIIRQLSPNRRASIEVYRGSGEGAIKYISRWKGG